MSAENRISVSLFLLRVAVFIVLIIWTLDKFINPAHASAIYANFYYIADLGSVAVYVIGAVELVIIIGFVLGVFKPFTYGAVLLFHAVSTLSSYKQYLAPYDGANILFFAAWPMLAACVALFLLRDLDTRFVVRMGMAPAT